MNHLFSNWLDDDCIRCEECGSNPYSATDTCPGKMQKYIPGAECGAAAPHLVMQIIYDTRSRSRKMLLVCY